MGRGVNVFMKEKSIIHAAALNSKPHLPSTRRENVLENSDWVMGLDQDIYSPLSTSKMIRGRDEGMGGWGKGMGREGESRRKSFSESHLQKRSFSFLQLCF